MSRLILEQLILLDLAARAEEATMQEQQPVQLQAPKLDSNVTAVSAVSEACDGIVVASQKSPQRTLIENTIQPQVHGQRKRTQTRAPPQKPNLPSPKPPHPQSPQPQTLLPLSPAQAQAEPLVQLEAPVVKMQARVTARDKMNVLTANSSPCNKKPAKQRLQKFVGTFRPLMDEKHRRIFSFVSYFIGKEGRNVKQIYSACNGKLRLRGEGSGYLEPSTRREAPIALQIQLSCLSWDDYVLGRVLVLELLGEAQKELAALCLKHRMKPPIAFVDIAEKRS